MFVYNSEPVSKMCFIQQVSINVIDQYYSTLHEY